LCKPGQDQSTCLTEPQVRTLEILYDGLRNPRTQALISPAFPRGIEDQLGRFLGSSGEFDMTRWVFGPDWDINTFDYDKDVDTMDAKLASITNAMNPDLSRFAARGGKLIMYHGLEDTAISPLDSLDYFDRIDGKGRPKAAFAALFFAPGMQHCFGGRGPSVFGQAPVVMSGNPDTDIVAALDRWVEKGQPPARIVASTFNPQPNGPGSRPLCPYPQTARYEGRGDRSKPDSYACVAAEPLHYEHINPRYRR
jgi:feruloyl esterase